ncbi:AfsR/SARP family transcriptional regulator [Lentzea tibetensis]|uniref:AfsR/SARP family transcriptional regulator n=1 Tax=Lentzea tibetensis TaxID=2591470 RepID=UPI0016472ED8|nr:AfsR/SARP family transcriptional regulator [Lentzea tibetensis]
MPVELRILGPLELWQDGDRVDIAGVHRQKLLAELAINLGENVPTPRLSEVLWNSNPPATGQQQLQRHVYALRQVLGSAITTEPGGYRLTLPPESVDAHRFATRIQEARSLRNSGLVEEAAAELVAALALWRGPALTGLKGPLRAEAERLDDQRLTAREDWFELQISLGGHADVLAELSEEVEWHPSRERLIGHLMLALYRCGRQADALTAYQRLRNRLLKELGLEPGEQLRTLHTAILRHDPALNPNSSDWSAHVPACLPMDLASFVGRADELRSLTSTAGSPIRLAAITGTAGVGKTALAVRWAHAVRDDFPDGQLYVDLRGHAPTPAMSASDALSVFLRALGTAPDRVPDGADARAALFRSTVDGKRMLVVLDNAASVEQVNLLLPGSPNCFVVVTSRNALTGLGVHHDAIRIGLDVLSDDEAFTLLRHVLGGPRVDAEAAEAGQLLRLCGNLPLAMRIVAANLANRPQGTIADTLRSLAEGDGLDLFSVEGEPRISVRAALDLSYRTVSPDAQRMLALLGASPLADFDCATVAALTGTPDARSALSVLSVLESAHLVHQHQPGRYRMHDLVKLYASEQPVTGLRDAVGDLLEHYLVHTDAAATKLAPNMHREARPTTITAVAADVDVVSWLTTESNNLVAAIGWARDHRHELLATHLIDALRMFFWMNSLTRDWISTGHTGLAMAQELGDARLQSAMHRTLGLAYYYFGDHRRALEHNLDSLAFCEALGDTSGAVAMHTNIAMVCNNSGMLTESISHLEEGIAIAAREGFADKESSAHLALSAARGYQGNLRLAVEEAIRAFDMAQQAGNPSHEAQAQLVHAWALTRMGYLHQAEVLNAAGRHAHHKNGNRGGELMGLIHLTEQRLAAGDLRAAQELIEQVLELGADQSDHVNEINALTAFARVTHASGDVDTALAACHRGVDRAQEIGNLRAGTEALLLLAELQLATGDITEASTTAATALEQVERSGQLLLSGDAHQVAARIMSAAGDAASAHAHLTTALAAHRQSGQRLREAADLILLGDPDAAADVCHEAVDDWAPDVLRHLHATLTP